MKVSVSNMILFLTSSIGRKCNAFSFVPRQLNTVPSTKSRTTTFLRSSLNGETSPYYITTPIYYVNDKPHIGHAYTSIACDVLARYKRLSNNKVFFLSGTDEHGQKVEQSANAKGVSPQEFVDTVSVNFRQMLKDLCISNDLFIRTTDDYHKKAVQVSFSLLL